MVLKLGDIGPRVFLCVHCVGFQFFIFIQSSQKYVGMWLSTMGNLCALLSVVSNHRPTSPLTSTSYRIRGALYLYSTYRELLDFSFSRTSLCFAFSTIRDCLS